jgi:hypothetical protein
MSYGAWRSRATWLVGLVLLASGCGVAEYESKMIVAQQRMERFEKEDQMLGPPLVIPKRLDSKKNLRPWANLFFRPPRGIRPKPVMTEGEEPEPEKRGGLLYQYVPPPKKTALGVARVELAFGDQKEFATELMSNFTATNEPKKSTRSFRPPGRQVGVTFETIEMEGTDQGIDYLYSINRTATKKNLQIAVVYWVLKSQAARSRGLIDLSLESFALNEEATEAREQYNRGSPLLVPQTPDAVSR